MPCYQIPQSYVSDTIYTHKGTLVMGRMSPRYVRINFSTNWGDTSYVCMVSLHVCNDAGTKWNNENMTHTTGGSLVNGTPQECSDTNTGTYWQTNYSGLPNWWKVDLGQERDVRIIKTQALSGLPNRNIKDFTVYFSVDNINWILMLTAQTAQNTNEQSFSV